MGSCIFNVGDVCFTTSVLGDMCIGISVSAFDVPVCVVGIKNVPSSDEKGVGHSQWIYLSDKHPSVSGLLLDPPILRIVGGEYTYLNGEIMNWRRAKRILRKCTLVRRAIMNDTPMLRNRAVDRSKPDRRRVKLI
jgi:hypothetical protein